MKRNKAYRYDLAAIDNSSEFGLIVAIRNKNAITKKDSFENTLITSKRKPNLIETGRGKHIYSKIFQNFSNNNNNKHFSRKSSLSAVFAERFNESIRDHLRRPVFEKSDGIWIDVLPIIKKQFTNRLHSTTKFTPVQVF